MSKRFKGKACAYCGSISETADHIFCRQFFPEELRTNLPQVPACFECNTQKASLEHYIVSVLPFGGSHPISPTILERDVPRRLDRNKKLHRSLSKGQRTVWVQERGLAVPRMGIPFDGEKFHDLVALIAKGLVNYHFGTLVPKDYVSAASFFVEKGQRLFQHLMLDEIRTGSTEVQANIASGLILYQGVQLAADPHQTLWRFQFYGGLKVSEDESRGSSGDVWASTFKPIILS